MDQATETRTANQIVFRTEDHACATPFHLDTVSGVTWDGLTGEIVDLPDDTRVITDDEYVTANTVGWLLKDLGIVTEVMVATDQIEEIKKAARKAARAAAKLGLPEPSIKVIGQPELIEQEFHATSSLRTIMTGVMIEAVKVRVTTPRFDLPGWKIVASLDLDPAGNVVSKAPAFYDAELPAEWHTMGDRCDHCELNRNRKTLVALESTDTGEFKIVGKSCLAEYVGHVDAYNLVKLAVSLSELVQFEGNGRGSGSELLVTVRTFVAMTVAIVRSLGFVPGGETRDQVTGFLFSSKIREKLIAAGVEVDADADLAKADELIEWAQAQNGNDYLENLKVAASRKEANRRTYGLLASLPGAYDRAMGWEIERKAKAEGKPESSHVGTVGKREVFTGTVVAARQSESYSYYGPDSLWLKLVDDEGNVLIWKTNTDTAEYSLYASAELQAEGVACGSSTLGVGDKITGKATVKEHSSYKGEAQTVVTRWKVETVVPG